MRRFGRAIAAGGLAWLGAVEPAAAQPVAGLYIGAGVGYGFLQDQQVASPSAILNSARFGSSLAALGEVGFGIGNGLRLEVEGDWRDSPQSGGRNDGARNGGETKAGVMVNALFDFDAGLDWLYPYVGLGGGYQWARWSKIGLGASVPGSRVEGRLSASGTVGEPAYQAMLGAAVPIGAVPGLSVTIEYRFVGVPGHRSYDAVATPPAEAATRVRTSDDANHTVLLGLRYALSPPEAGRFVPRPPLATPQAAAPIRTYLVFFDWDSAALSARARDIIGEAVRNSAHVEHTRLEVTGHSDRTGTAEYNQALSLRRAQAVAQEVERWGIPPTQVAVRGVGDAQPLVATEAGVREPQNRRVEILYR